MTTDEKATTRCEAEEFDTKTTGTCELLSCSWYCELRVQVWAAVEAPVRASVTEVWHWVSKLESSARPSSLRAHQR